MKRFLRSHGLRFHPNDWTASARNPNLAGRQPCESWAIYRRSCIGGAPTKMAKTSPAAGRFARSYRIPESCRAARKRIPSLFTTRIAYYGFIAWAVQELNQRTWTSGTVLRELFHKLERAYVLCEFIHHGNEASDCRVIGQRSKSEVLQTGINDRFRPPIRIMKNQAAAGSLRLYATSLESMGFAELRPERVADGLLPILLTDLGHAPGANSKSTSLTVSSTLRYPTRPRLAIARCCGVGGNSSACRRSGGYVTARHSWSSATARPPNLATAQSPCF
jgi:hypothetical protein